MKTLFVGCCLGVVLVGSGVGAFAASEAETAKPFREFAGSEETLYLAAELLRGSPQICTPLVASLTNATSRGRMLLEAEAALVAGRKDEALAALQRARAKWTGEGATPGEAPTYPVELPSSDRGYGGSARPFANGPGSHKDNWLVRRFAALEQWSAACMELERIWQYHRYVGTERPQASGLTGAGLSFAVDYAYTLKTRAGDAPAAQAILTEALLAMDMDRNPQQARPVAGGLPALQAKRTGRQLVPVQVEFVQVQAAPLWWGHGGYAGLSRTEFIRIVFGAAKNDGWLPELEAALVSSIDAGTNRTRRVLAQVRRQQARGADALALELAYLDNAKLPLFTELYRRGCVLQDAGENERAVDALGKLLALETPDHVVGLADPGEQAAEVMRSSMPLDLIYAQRRKGTYVRDDALARLERSYRALGRTDDVLVLSLQRASNDTAVLSDARKLGELAARFERAGKADEFERWLKEMARTYTSGACAVGLQLYLKDYGKAAEAASYAAHGNRYELQRLVEQFREGGDAAVVALLRAISEKNPAAFHARLMLLDYGAELSRDELMETLQGILRAPSHDDVFGRGKGVYNRTSFRNLYEVAYRLMRLYEQTGQREGIVALGMRILTGDKPFKRDTPLATVRPNWHERQLAEDVLDCIWVMLPYIETDTQKAALKRAVAAHDCAQLAQQVSRVLGGTAERIAPDTLPVVTPAENDDLLLLTNHDDVRAISKDGLWVGTSWGLIGYGQKQMHRLPLGTGVQCIEPDGSSGYWVGTRNGLYSLHGTPDSPQPTLRYIPLSRGDDMEERPIRIESVVVQANSDVWAAGSDGVWQISRTPRADQAMAIRYHGRSGESIFMHGDLICSDQGIYNTALGSFAPVTVDPIPASRLATLTNFAAVVAFGKSAREAGMDRRTPVRLIGSTGGILWGDVSIDDRRRHRPAIIDPATHAATPLRDAVGWKTQPGQEHLMVNHELAIITHTNGVTWFGGTENHHDVILAYSHAKGELRYVRHRWDKHMDAPSGPTVWRFGGGGSGSFGRVDLSTGRWELPAGLQLAGDRGPRFVWQERPDGKLLLGASIVREWWEDNLGYDNNEGMSHHILKPEGGLFLVAPATLAWSRVDRSARQLSDFYINNLRMDRERGLLYVCTNGGLTMVGLREGFPILSTLTVLDGLPANKVEDVARIGSKLYIATCLGDDRGGLAVQDLETQLLQTYHVSDGLESEKVRRLKADGEKLHILYGTQFMRGRKDIPNRGRRTQDGKRVVGFPATVWDTRTGVWHEGQELLPPPMPPDRNKPLPVLGGEQTCHLEWNGWELIGGTHGLVFSRKAAHKRHPSPPQATVVTAQAPSSWDASGLGDMTVSTADALAAALASPNGAVRAQAIVASSDRGRRKEYAAFIPLYAAALKDTQLRVRCSAVWLLTHVLEEGNREAIPPLRVALADADLYIRSVAALELIRAGERVSPLHIAECMLGDRHFGNFPHGATSSVGVIASPHAMLDALAGNAASAEEFAWLFAFPFRVDDYEPRIQTATAAGERLREHPEWLPDLLSLQQEREWYDSAVQLAQHVMGYAGPSLLPALHEALGSDDRVVRSNAARGCGAIGDALSIPYLLQALERESGLSRASCVWALGELEAREALPQLCALFAEAKADAASGRGQFLGQQMASVHQAQYRALGSLASAGQDMPLSGLAPANNAPASKYQLERREHLLKPEDVLEALAKIGPGLIQPFYRGLAGDPDHRWRQEASRQLGAAAAAERTASVATLRNMLADATRDISDEAAVSLARLADTQGIDAIVLRLAADEYPHRLLDMMKRLNGSQLTPLASPLRQLCERCTDRHERSRIDQLLSMIKSVER